MRKKPLTSTRTFPSFIAQIRSLSTPTRLAFLLAAPKTQLANFHWKAPSSRKVWVHFPSSLIEPLPSSCSFFFLSSTGADWIRLIFDREVTTAPLIRITSLLDGAVQHLNPKTLAQWQYTSAYFNGDSVLVEFFDQAGHASDYAVQVVAIQAGLPTLISKDKSLCGPDSRELSSFKRSGRYLGSGGCSGCLINDRNGCFLSAHHCGVDATGSGVMEFEVPLSRAVLGGYVIVHPPPEHQYALDPASLIRATSPVGVGNDWQYFGW